MKKPKVHFIGIGGIGVSALARWFLAQNWAVSGSDMAESGITRELRKEGVKVKIGHVSGNLTVNKGMSPDMVIYSSAIPKKNPEIKAAKRLGVEPISYPQAVGQLTKLYETIAIAGSHGKSTTSALTGLILKDSGLDPTIIIGTKLKELHGKNFRPGKKGWLVLEADEWNAAFLNYRPYVALVTNIDREHLDFYKNLGRLKKTFLGFLANVRRGGFLVLNRDDKNLFSLRSPIAKRAFKNGIKVFWYGTRNVHAKKIKRILRIPGIHNVSNAVGAYTIASKILHIKEKDVLKTLGAYRGAWRRMEYRGKFHGALVYDDYGHHPTEIKATLKAFKEKYPKKILLCVFQPHQAKRLAALFKEFQTAFDDADETLIMPIYRVAGRDLSGQDEPLSRFDSAALTKAIQKKQPKKLLFYLQKPEHLKQAVLSLKSPLRNKVIVMMGAGNIVDYTPLLLGGK